MFSLIYPQGYLYMWIQYLYFFFFSCLSKLDFFMFVFGDWRVRLMLVYSGSWCWSCISDTISVTDSFTKYSTEFAEFHTGHNIKKKTPSFLIKQNWFFFDNTHQTDMTATVNSQTDFFKQFSPPTKSNFHIWVENNNKAKWALLIDISTSTSFSFFLFSSQKLKWRDAFMNPPILCKLFSITEPESVHFLQHCTTRLTSSRWCV